MLIPKKYVMRRPETLLKPLLFELPEPACVQGGNDRHLCPANFGKYEVLYTTNSYTFEVRLFRKSTKRQDNYTGGSAVFYPTREESREHAFNVSTYRHLAAVRASIIRFKEG